MIHWISWIGIILGVTIISYIIASAIPVFNSLVSLIGALLGTLQCTIPMGMMWIFDNYRSERRGSFGWNMKLAWSIFIMVIGLYLMVAGTYGSVLSIIASYNESGGSAAWSCADNSSS